MHYLNMAARTEFGRLRRVEIDVEKLWPPTSNLIFCFGKD